MCDTAMHQRTPARWCFQQDLRCRHFTPPPMTPPPSSSSSDTSVPGTPALIPVPASWSVPKRKLNASSADDTRPRTRRRARRSSDAGARTDASDSDSGSTGSGCGAFQALLAVAAHEQQLHNAQRAQAAAHSEAQTLWKATLAANMAAALSTLPPEELQRVQEARRFLALF
ncbi:hypothetical protein ABPG77_009357 [Micractinium sp. CCAP 211/92]